MNNIILYCRPGFEKECAAEITEKAAKWEFYGFARVKENSGYVVFVCCQHGKADRLIRTLPLRSLIFARQMILAGDLLCYLPTDDRITPIVGMLTGPVTEAGKLRVEVPDTNKSKELMKFCLKFTVPLHAALRAQCILLGGWREMNAPRSKSSMCCLSRRNAPTWATPIGIIILPSTWAFPGCDFRRMRLAALR